jgi:hypothetical protein
MPSPGQLALGLVDDPVAIREALASQLRATDRGVRLVPEMGLCQGNARIDLAAIGEDLEGYEIKSGRDDLRRLAYQALVYGRVFNRLTLVAPRRHLDGAAEILPRWWGLCTVEEGSNALRGVRPPSPNPDRQKLDVARLLWRDEAAILVKDRLDRPPRGTRRVLWEELAECLPSDELTAAVCQCLRYRTGWRAAD